jgi:hypothetical protein
VNRRVSFWCLSCGPRTSPDARSFSTRMRHPSRGACVVAANHLTLNFQLAVSKRKCAHGLSHSVVHRRRSTNAGASQSGSRISGLVRQARIERLHGDKDAGENVGGCGSTGVRTGRHGRGGHSLPHQANGFPNLPIILLSAYSEMPEGILWLGDDYVMKSELLERLLPIVERAHRRSDERCQRSGARASSPGNAPKRPTG